MEERKLYEATPRPSVDGRGVFVVLGRCNGAYFVFFSVTLLPPVFPLKPLEGRFRGLQVKAFILS